MYFSGYIVLTLFCHFSFFFFNQKTAYDVRISDWSSAVCSSDLESYELFMDLLDDSYSQDALDFPVVFASGKAGVASLTKPENGTLPDGDSLEPLFQTILETIPAPEYDEGAPLQAHVTNLDSSPFLVRLALVRVHQGVLKKGQNVSSDEQTSELQSLMRISYAVFCLKKKK